MIPHSLLNDKTDNSFFYEKDKNFRYVYRVNKFVGHLFISCEKSVLTIAFIVREITQGWNSGQGSFLQSFHNHFL